MRPLLTHYLQLTITLTLLLLFSVGSNAQIQIIADTISLDCTHIYGYRSRNVVYIIASQNDYEQSEFFTSDNDGECLAFKDVDFDKSIVVGYKYHGSNCDRTIKWSTIINNENNYLIQFATWPNHVCRDLRQRIAWFILNKPIASSFDIKFERVYKQWTEPK
jgi:hypothetical protein